MTPTAVTTAAVLALAPALAAPAAPAVERHADVAYRTGPGSDPVRHTLDVYVPKGGKDFPVLVFVHGGTWKSGRKDLYTALGEAFAREGLGVVVTNYRLTPTVRHPGHARDVAAAVAWTLGNIGRYGGDPKRVFAMGHSAGGHLVSLVATDPTFLLAHDRAPADLRGVVSVSGVYLIPPAFRGLAETFGDRQDACDLASPAKCVRGRCPPFLLAYADKDFDQLDKSAELMRDALRRHQSPCDLEVCKGRDHYTILINLLNPEDPLRRRVLGFVRAAGK